jgi:hypothetical protein
MTRNKLTRETTDLPCESRQRTWIMSRTAVKVKQKMGEFPPEDAAPLPSPLR